MSCGRAPKGDSLFTPNLSRLTKVQKDFRYDPSRSRMNILATQYPVENNYNQ